MRKRLMKFSRTFECEAVQGCVHLVDLVKSFQTSSNFHFSVSLHVPFSQFLFERDSYSNEYLLFTSIYLQNLASIQPRTDLSNLAKNEPQVRKKLGKHSSARSSASIYERLVVICVRCFEEGNRSLRLPHKHTRGPR